MSVNLDNMLLTACKNGQKGIVQAFLKKGGIQLDKRDVQGATPLHYASAKGSRDIVKLLLDAGADHLSQIIKAVQHCTWLVR